MDISYWQYYCYASQSWRPETHSGGLRSSVMKYRVTKKYKYKYKYIYKTCLVPGVVAVEKPTQVSCINTEPNFSHTKRTPQTNKSMRKGKSNKKHDKYSFWYKTRTVSPQKRKKLPKR